MYCNIHVISNNTKSKPVILFSLRREAITSVPTLVTHLVFSSMNLNQNISPAREGGHTIEAWDKRIWLKSHFKNKFVSVKPTLSFY